jgi:arginase
MKVQIIQVPYDSGHRSIRMGGGPEHFVHNGLANALRDYGHDVSVHCVEAPSQFRAEIRTAFELHRAVAERVRFAYDNGAFPLVLSGNCNGSLGAVGGIGSNDQLGIIWFDGHGDFNTPETTESGFLDGMALATAAGLCWKKMTASIPGFRAVPADNILHVGGRDFYAEEQTLFEESGGTIVDAETISRLGITEALNFPLRTLRMRGPRIYLHFDLDVLDPTRAPANEFAAPGGITVSQIQEAIEMIGQRFTICACGVASYDPRYDREDEVLTAGMTIIKSVVATVNVSDRQFH